MKIQLIHPNAQLPTRSTEHAAGFDIYMPEAGKIPAGMVYLAFLGFASEIPEGWVAFMFPRSGRGSREGLELANTCGVIDPDYRGEWKAAIKTKAGQEFTWEAGERILQVVLVPRYTGSVEQVESVAGTIRGSGGFGSTGS